MLLTDARPCMTIRDNHGGIWKVVCVDQVGHYGSGYSVTIEHCHKPIRIVARKDETLEEFRPLLNGVSRMPRRGILPLASRPAPGI